MTLWHGALDLCFALEQIQNTRGPVQSTAKRFPGAAGTINRATIWSQARHTHVQREGKTTNTIGTWDVLCSDGMQTMYAETLHLLS